MTTEQLDFEPLNLSEIQQESERVNQEETKGSDDYLAKFVKLPERDGYVNMRFLPKLRGKKLYCATKIHYLDDGTGTGKTKVYHSPKKLEFNDKGQPRWIGESVIDLFLRDLWSRSEKANEKDRKEMRRLYSRTKGVERYYYWVIVREEKDAEGKINKNQLKIFSCGKTVHAMILRAISGDPKLGIKPLGDVTHPKTGRDFKLVKKMTKAQDPETMAMREYANYDLSAFDTSESPLGTDEEIALWLSQMYDLEDLKKVKSEDELKIALKVHLGVITPTAASASSASSKTFDSSEFQVNHTGTSSTPAATQQVEIRQELTTSVDDSQSVEDSVLADPDFLKELENAVK